MWKTSFYEPNIIVILKVDNLQQCENMVNNPPNK